MMKRIDHILFQADTDFIAYFDSLPLPGGEVGLEPCNCFGHFIANRVRSKKDVSQAMCAVEAVLREEGLNAQQLRQWFFPALNAALRDDELRSSMMGTFGPLSMEIWSTMQSRPRTPVV
jgi:hypothetical protein